MKTALIFSGFPHKSNCLNRHFGVTGSACGKSFMGVYSVSRGQPFEMLVEQAAEFSSGG